MAPVKIKLLQKLILNRYTCGWYDSMSQVDDYINNSSFLANGGNKTLQH